ncbi:LCP family protein [Actinomadura keratinilytica]|jgi:LCP family protein required for cell wall assembly|uniref:Cell envelope-related transcriptional attenuator domain-containing protein n=1 Tax=Actinomadura keratinilytica TaxID=547461 RepID=A0ABP7ZAU3_9ACTN
MASRSAARPASEEDEDAESTAPKTRGLLSALGLTLASTLVWGVAHLRVGRRWAGGLLLGLFVALAAAGAVAGLFFRADLLQLAVRPDWLTGLAAGILALGLLWITVVIRSYQIVRPEALSLGARSLGVAGVIVLCFAVALPTAWAGYSTYLYRDALTSIFRTGDSHGRPINVKDPWNGQRRVNVLLLGGDAAANREGVRTDSMTVASIDTKTGDTVLLSLPRNLERVPMPPGPARDRFPYGFTGDGPATPGLLNEVYQYAEDHPDIVPGARKNERGPELLKATISGILGLPVDYYVLVDMFGFADIIDAIGGVKIKITQPIHYGLEGGVLQPGDRTLSGKEALWYGRSRTYSDDYTRMGRQKCLLRAIARQADPQTVLTSFDRLAAATKRAISTDIPQELLPAFITLSKKFNDGGQVTSLQFVPPLIYTGNPDYALIRRLAAQAVATPSESASPSPSASASGSGSASPRASRTPRASSSAEAGRQTKPVSLDATCP